MMNQIKSQNATQRVSVHSHVKNLGVDVFGNPLDSQASCGLVGQFTARQGLALICKAVNEKAWAGRGILLSGPSGTGKTALAIALSNELGSKIPFRCLIASEVYSNEVKKTEVLMESLRRAVGLRIREIKDVYEGEVNELSPCLVENAVEGYSKTVSHVIVGLKSIKGSKQLKLDPIVYEAMLKENVQLGDVIYIEASTGTVKRLGRSDNYSSEFDLEAEEYVPIPKGDVYKRKEFVSDVTLYDLDLANASPQGGSDVISIVNQLVRPRKTEITDRLRCEIDRMVNRYIEKDIAQLIPGVLFIDEAHMLDMECFSFLNKALEMGNAPVIVLATNRGMSVVRGSSTVSAHGMPPEFLDRLMIVKTGEYSDEEVLQIIQMRAAAEQLELDMDEKSNMAVFLVELVRKHSLRYVNHLLSLAQIVGLSNGRELINVQDMVEVTELFADYKGKLVQ